MSRYHVDHPIYDVCVGWDDPLETFFLSVMQPAPNDDPEDKEVFSAGLMPKEIVTVSDLKEVCAKHQIEIPQDLAEQLGEDFDNREEPTPLQLRVRLFF